MSLPTQQLQDLAIGGGMKTISNRSRAQRRRRQHEANARAAAEAARHATPIIGRSGHHYSVSQLSPDLHQSVAHGLQSENVVVDFSRVLHVTEDRPYYAFQLREAASIRVCDPTAFPRTVTCTCEAFRKVADSTVCAHIYWLYDGLNHVLGDVPKESLLPLDRPSVEQRFSVLRGAIEARIDRLPDALNLISDEPAEDVDEMVKDMLALFIDLDDEFYSVVPEMENQSLQSLVVPGNLSVTIFALARHDPVFRGRLRNVITKDLCAGDFLRKLNKKRRDIVAAIDEYTGHGSEIQARFVNNCAIGLRQIIAEISTYRESDRAPLSPKFDTMAAQLAMKILEDVCDRNRDVYEGENWKEAGAKPEEERSRNLFANLVSDPAPRFSANFFVLDFLTDELPPPAWLDHVGDLERLLGRFTEQEAGTQYIDKMQELVSQSQSGGQLYEETEDTQSPTSPGSEWRHTVGVASASAVPTSRRERRPTLEESRSPQRRRLD